MAQYNTDVGKTASSANVTEQAQLSHLHQIESTKTVYAPLDILTRVYMLLFFCSTSTMRRRGFGTSFHTEARYACMHGEITHVYACLLCLICACSRACACAGVFICIVIFYRCICADCFTRNRSSTLSLPLSSPSFMFQAVEMVTQSASFWILVGLHVLLWQDPQT